MCYSWDGPGDRTRARAHLRARQGLLQEDGVVLHVQQAEQGAVSVGDLLAHRGEPAAVHALQEAPVHRRVALLAAASPEARVIAATRLRNVFTKLPTAEVSISHCFITLLVPSNYYQQIDAFDIPTR